MVSETKIGNSFPVGNFLIDGFSTPYWLHRDSNGGGIMLYVREDIPSICNHLDALSTYLDLHSTTYEKKLILGDFNVGIEEQHVKAFGDNYNLTSLIKQLKCYKIPNNPTCIDLILLTHLEASKVLVL